MSAHIVVPQERHPIALHRTSKKSIGTVVLLATLLAISIAVNAMIILAAGGR